MKDMKTVRQGDTADHGLSLRRRRRWFADDATPTDEGQQDTPPDQDPQDDGTSAETETTGADDREPMIPRDRFDAVNDRAKAAEKKLAAIEAERQKERQAAEKQQQVQLAEQGKFKELYEAEQQKVTAADTKAADLETQLKAATEKLDALTAVIQAQVETRLETVPEYVRDLLKDKPPLDQATWLDEHADDLGVTRQGAPRQNAGDGLRSPQGRTVGLNKSVRL